MSQRIAWLVLLCMAVWHSLLGRGAAAADELSGHVGPVRQERHHVKVTLKRGHAVWHAERRLWSRVDNEAVLRFDMPGPPGETERAVAIGLSLLRRDGWSDAKLLDAAVASERHFSGGGDDSASALLSELGTHSAEIHLAGVGPRSPQSLRYTLLVPTSYDDGRHALLVPPNERALAASIRAHVEDGQLLVDGRPWPEGVTIDYDPTVGVELALRPERAAPLEGELVVIPFGGGFLTRTHLNVAPRLSELPRRARVVLALDASRSTSGERFASLRHAARAYLEHLPDAQVELVSFHRDASAHFGRFVSRARALRTLADWQPTFENGTEPQRALALATERLREAPVDAPKRIVLLTDGLLRSDHDAATLAEALDPAVALTQLVSFVFNGADYLDRSDPSDAWSEVAATSGGLAWRGSLSGRAPDDEMLAMYLQLVRPVLLEGVEVDSAAWLNGIGPKLMNQLREGQGVAELESFSQPVPWLTVRAKLWTDDIELSFGAREDHDGVWSALVFGDGRFPSAGVDRSELLALAQRGRVVTPLTSYLVGRTREPPPPRQDELLASGVGFGFSGGCRGCGVDVSGRHPGNRRVWLTDQVRHTWYRCGGSLHRVQVDLEVVRGEIVLVDDIEGAAGSSAEMATCLHDALWQLELHPMFADDESVIRYHVDARPLFQ